MMADWKWRATSWSLNVVCFLRLLIIKNLTVYNITTPSFELCTVANILRPSTTINYWLMKLAHYHTINANALIGLLLRLTRLIDESYDQLQWAVSKMRPANSTKVKYKPIRILERANHHLWESFLLFYKSATVQSQ
ncbi:hypothetical protein HZ326_15142 [Fusarium oxysporum f. sp. albedinis]|nr:hypothetical protein HZ326_15142 [Fusarium oxysporum f. sp. albedinis]